MATANPDNILFFIPDISGFTKFVTETEVSHSQHIIQELLELIVDANQLGLEVSEFEGDAVLFVRPGAPPSLDELLARHVVPALRAAGAMRSGRDTVRLAEEPVTEHRGGDVHVHLGRIEVVQPPAAAQSRPARSRPRPPAPDHEAYLAARRKPDRR